MIDYKTLFERVEATLLEVGSRQLPVEQIRANLEPYKHFAGQRFTNDEYYWKLVGVIFYTGFRAATVTERLDILRGYFSNYLEV
ncbi:MAG TPA: hypothetical protein VIV15_04565, partial [Anaerolineales bacterium]